MNWGKQTLIFQLKSDLEALPHFQQERKHLSKDQFQWKSIVKRTLNRNVEPADNLKKQKRLELEVTSEFEFREMCAQGGQIIFHLIHTLSQFIPHSRRIPQQAELRWIHYRSV